MTTQAEVYEGTTRALLDSVLDGYNATVFAYGATGCGKTHTITGTAQHPGIIFLTMQELFEKIDERSQEKHTELTLSYLEIYNETIRDLLVPGGSKIGLALREDSSQAVVVPGLTSHRPRDVQEVMDMIVRGNEYRTVSPTEANATSSRSHAVLQINIAQKDRNADVNEPHTMATLSIIDLAGSERASVTKNCGERLTEGANINKSLLALGGCINALCDKSGKMHVPYRNSKLTRLLKFSLGGNCKTVMIVCVSPSSAHYDETQNTLRYANRAKDIQTTVTRNVFNVNRHVKDFLIKIDEQMALINELRAQQRDSEKVHLAKFRKQYEKRDAIVREATQRLRAAYENASAERQERVTAMRKVKHFERRICLLSAWIAAFDAVANRKEGGEEEMPQGLKTIRRTAEGILLELENSRHHSYQKLEKSMWERHLDTALAHGIRQLEQAEGTDTGETDTLTREAELLKANFRCEAYQEVLEQERVGDAAMMQVVLTAQFEMMSSLSSVESMDEESAVEHAKDVISRLLQDGLTAASQVVKPDGTLPAVPDALPPRRTLRKRKSLSAYRPVAPPAIVAVQNEHVFATPMKSSPRRRKALGMPKKGVSFTPVKRAPKGRGVRWRDDETEDGTLEDFEKTPQKLLSSSPPVQPSPAAKSKIPSPPSQSSSTTKDDASNNDTMSPDSDTLSISIPKPGRFQAGFLSRGKRLSAEGSGLPVSASPPALSMHLRSSSSSDVERTPPLRSLEVPKPENGSPLSYSKVPRLSPQYHPLQMVMDENNPPNGSGSDSESGTIDMRKLRSAIALKKPRRIAIMAPTSAPAARRVSSIGSASGDRPPPRPAMPVLASATNGISRHRRGSLELRKSPPLMCAPSDLISENLTAGQARRMNMGSNMRLENLGAAQRDKPGLEAPHRVTYSVGPKAASAGITSHRRLDSRGGMPIR